MSVLSPVVSSWDGANRRIHLLQGVSTFDWMDDIYKEYRNWRRTNESARAWEPLMIASGNNPKGGGKFTPRYITLLNGCRVVPYDENILIEVTGEAITDNADVDPDPFDTSTRTQPLKLYITPPAAEIIQISSGSGLSATQSTQLLEIFRALMLDPTTPVRTTVNKIEFDDVVINLTGDPKTEIIGTRE